MGPVGCATRPPSGPWRSGRRRRSCWSARCPPKSAAPKKDLVGGECGHQGDAGGIEWVKDRLSLLGLLCHPAADGRVVRGLVGRQQGGEDLLDLAETDASGKGNGGHLPQPGGIAKDGLLGVLLGEGELPTESLILGLELSQFGLSNGRIESLLDLMGVLINRLSAAPDLAGLIGDSPEDVGKDGGSVANDGAER